MPRLNTELIVETWNTLEDHDAFIDAFYGRFFERFPGYRRLFPHRLNPSHLAKMVDTMFLMSTLAEDKHIIAPHMHRLGAAHKPYALEPRDLANFKAVFLETLGERLGLAWTPMAATAWNDAFDDVIIPLMREGTGR